MRSHRSPLILLLAASSLLSFLGCSDDDAPKSSQEALAEMETLRNEKNWGKSVPVQPPVDPVASPKPAPPGDEAQQGTFTVKVESSCGDFMIQVHRDWAPVGAERFYQLVKSGYYDECRFFRVVPGFMVQFGMNGDPAVQQQWERKINDDPVTQSNKPGYVTFATSGPNSRTTQIFISYGDNSFLDEQGFSPFGKVIEGMENVNAINSEYEESPQQGSIKGGGNEYLNREFPRLDYVKKMSIGSEPAE